jgi:hypothetical protein
MENFLEDFIVEDLIKNKEKKKKIDGGKKGDRVELGLCKLLEKRFNKSFSRSLGSGNRWSQISNMPKHAKDTFLGDLCAPEGFRYVIESKGGYDDEVNLNNVFKGISCLDGFIEKVTKDAIRAEKLPLLVWKPTRKPHVACLFKSLIDETKFDQYISYKYNKEDWVLVSLNKLLEVYGDEFFFTLEKIKQ